MADVKIYLYSNCSSCRRADELLSASGLDYERRDIYREPMTPDEIKALLLEIGRTPSEVLSKRSIPYRELGLATRDVPDDELIALMSKHPGLLRRPILVSSGSDALVGYSQRSVEELISNVGAKNRAG